jgi:outer membrane beta-barrel protein
VRVDYYKLYRFAWSSMFVRQNPYLRVVYFCFFYIFSGTIAAGQSKDTLTIGSINGKVKDSIYNFMLTSATIAVYKDRDSSLLQYTLPNNFGEFNVPNLPVNTPLRLIITHVGYKDLVREFTILVEKKELAMGMLYLYQLARDSSGNMLEKVVVTAIAPMRMKGDTLEFNADAFKMDPNATTEDLMRRLPGIVIWGDGDITFNGKKIQQVLVDGKPFMGTNDITVATQNLPKHVIDKVQIYQQSDKKNPLDSTMYANLKLKEDKKMGYFGKVSAGSGASPASISTNKRYTADGMLSGFNKKWQIAAVAAANNINKIAGNVDALLKNSSFKGEGTNLEYQSDFNMRGVNKPIMGGVRLQSDFIADVQHRKNSRLNADYFINHNNKQVINTNLEKNFITADTILSRESNSTSYDRNDDQRASIQYTRNTEVYSINVSASGAINENRNKNESNSAQEKTGIGIINKNSSVNENNSTSKNMQAGFSFTRQGPYSDEDKKRIPSEFIVGYAINAGDNTGKSKSQSNYEFANEPQRNRNVSRIYDKHNSNSVEHAFTISYPRLKELIFGRRRFGGINIELSARYKLYQNNNNDEVLDLDTNNHVYILNIELTYNSMETVRDFTPKLHLSKEFYKVLTNRYNKYVSIHINAVQQYYNYDNSSTRAIQNIGYSYQKFIPDASVEYSNHQYGQYEVRYSFGYNSKAHYPAVWQMAPVADAANPLYLPKVNKNLKPAYLQDINIKYSFTTRTPKNPWNIDAGISLGKVTDNIVDSTLYDEGGGKTVYMINIEGYKYLNGSVNIRKALAVNKANTFEPGVHYDYNLSNDPRYIDSKLNISMNRSHGVGLYVNYRCKDIVQAKLEQGLNYNNAGQRGFNNSRFKSNYRYTRAIATLQFPKNLVWSSNITYNRNVADGTDAIRFTIWNTNLTYRFLKGNQAELKFSALDLLRQNKGITNTVYGNVQNFGYTNVLQQYFMCTLAYYPRKFGK